MGAYVHMSLPPLVRHNAVEPSVDVEVPKGVLRIVFEEENTLPGLVIKAVDENCPAHGLVRPNDRLVAVNDVDAVALSQAQVQDILFKSRKRPRVLRVVRHEATATKEIEARSPERPSKPPRRKGGGGDSLFRRIFRKKRRQQTIDVVAMAASCLIEGPRDENPLVAVDALFQQLVPANVKDVVEMDADDLERAVTEGSLGNVVFDDIGREAALASALDDAYERLSKLDARQSDLLDDIGNLDADDIINLVESPCSSPATPPPSPPQVAHFATSIDCPSRVAVPVASAEVVEEETTSIVLLPPSEASFDRVDLDPNAELVYVDGCEAATPYEEQHSAERPMLLVFKSRRHRRRPESSAPEREGTAAPCLSSGGHLLFLEGDAPIAAACRKLVALCQLFAQTLARDTAWADLERRLEKKRTSGDGYEGWSLLVELARDCLDALVFLATKTIVAARCARLCAAAVVVPLPLPSSEEGDLDPHRPDPIPQPPKQQQKQQQQQQKHQKNEEKAHGVIIAQHADEIARRLFPDLFC
ncbi:hypothetical protein CTAYLR_000043 [Chrysophaeum taylorii]|uniref:PDZ domain-containing protein n=1 Tax=Chrysophaeum taylorii TaxID=2483200 RepID=A0AAD7UIU7_9STRA|nr:hypothetical protein CTAYLR_000043 [Chrysophaeum taylorii]